jgi:hypothetical protein
MSRQGPPGIQYPTLTGIDRNLDAAVRNIYDNLFYLRKFADNPAVISPALRREVQQLITSQLTTIINTVNNITSVTTIIGTHALRLGSYGAATQATGTMFYEVDRHVLYVINDIPNKHWEFVAGCMVGVIADQPGDLSTTDVGFLFFATDTTTLYIWDGTAWQSLSSSGVFVDAYGALDGDGTIGDPLAVRVDGDFVQININNNLTLSDQVTTRSISFTFDGGGAVIASGSSARLPYIPFDCEIIGWAMAADQSGSIEIDLLVDPTYPPTTSITGGNEPALSTADYDEDFTLTGWTTALATGDKMIATINGSPTSVTQVTITLILLLT